MTKPHVDPTSDWRLLEEVFCEDGDNDRAIREFSSRRPDLTGQPKRLQIQLLSHRESGASTVRFLWDHATPEPAKKRKPRSK